MLTQSLDEYLSRSHANDLSMNSHSEDLRRVQGQTLDLLHKQEYNSPVLVQSLHRFGGGGHGKT